MHHLVTFYTTRQNFHFHMIGNASSRFDWPFERGTFIFIYVCHNFSYLRLRTHSFLNFFLRFSTDLHSVCFDPNRLRVGQPRLVTLGRLICQIILNRTLQLSMQLMLSLGVHSVYRNLWSNELS